jgi:hypothetical protein
MERINSKAPLTKKIEHIYKELGKNWRDKIWWKGRFIHYIVGGYYRRRPNRGVYVMEEDWDNLIILDTCRYDTFVEVTGMNVDYRISRGLSTPKFLRESFVNCKFNDAVYVTTNPWVGILCGNYALRVGEECPDKRLIIHFLQPHWWYISDPKLAKYVADNHSHGEIVGNPWVPVEKGVFDLTRVYSSHKRDLKLAYRHVLQLIKKLTGKTAITADSEAFGERGFGVRILGHPSNIHKPALVKVPWVVFDSKERREIKEGDEKQKLKYYIRKLREKSKI